MKDSFYNIIKGKFLVSDDALKNWRFIVFLSLLALIMIGSSHTADKKVHQISKLNAQVKELKSEYVDIRMRLMQSKMESRIISALESKGLQPSSTPPKRIRIIGEKGSEEKRIASN
ncbi:S-adenosyl-methyltransferase [Aequorivita sp. H23M31]|uniref:S-adenosyl-methyltransferase n=1 Tax=Aequorivita ciconiae TaxID=2494375 RepID=A0A410G2V0_9FLAO|nr:FtsL-like putative cell division protein [Aequorivita sp. H23M31]QAA81602.1 S-adenosyl-methyltransferase [Aequorivita sp. H23M31]